MDPIEIAVICLLVFAALIFFALRRAQRKVQERRNERRDQHLDRLRSG
ncbi:MAG: hypothetical protein KDJ17_11800 [Hyphomicrobiaceae bacterium]|nr:hypothetical protein [Hyphomicrobiaceae bacterium]